MFLLIQICLEVVLENGITEEIWDRDANTAYQIDSLLYVLCSCNSWLFARIEVLW